jgi:ribosomal RNA-processing protein 12
MLIQLLTSTNREIIKSTLGFIKLSIHTLPPSLLSPHLESLVPNLLVWAKDYKNHFKVRVQHIFERMMRVFGAQTVITAVKAGDEEGTKILEAVRKRKERAKRKKRAAREQEEQDADVRYISA